MDGHEYGCFFYLSDLFLKLSCWLITWLSFSGKMKINNYFKNIFPCITFLVVAVVWFFPVFFFSHKNALHGSFWAKLNLSTTNIDITHWLKSRHSHTLISLFLLLLIYHSIRSNWKANMPNYLLWENLEGDCHSADYILSQVKTVELKNILFEGIKKQKCELFSKAIPMILHTCILVFCLFNLDYSFLVNVF